MTSMRANYQVKWKHLLLRMPSRPNYTSNKGSSTWFISDEEHQSVTPVKTIPPPRWQTAPRLTVEVSRPTNVRWACGFPDGQVEAGRLFSTLFPPTTDQPVLIHRCNTTFRSLLLFNSMLMSWARMWGNHLNIACDNKTLIFHAAFLVAIKSSMQEVF